MMQRGPDNLDEQPDALRRRLGALRDRPVDLTRLTAFIEEAVPPDVVILPHPTLLWRRRVMSIAASLLVLVSVGIAIWLTLAAKPALAAPQLLAEIHDQALAMRHIQVASFDEARRVLANEWASGPDVPTIDGAVPMECCMHKLGSKVVKCVSLEVEGEKVIMVVGHDKDITQPQGEIVIVHGQKLILTSNNGVNMAMSERDGRWICLMGRMDGARLVELAGSIR
jgi:hypothetical protein